MRCVESPLLDAYYRVLRTIDAGADAANIHADADPLDEELTRAYLRAGMRERLIAQVAPLCFIDDPASLVAASARGEVGPWRSWSGDRLVADLAARARQRPDSAPILRELAPPPWVERFLELREALYERVEHADVIVLNVPALTASSGFTHGRAVSIGGGRVVAVSFDAEDSFALIQALHEEIHPITDPPIREIFAGVAQRTDGHGEGGVLHAELERAAVHVGAALIQARDPALMPAYERWCARYHMAPDGSSLSDMETGESS